MVVTPEPSLWILDGDTWVEREGNYVNQEVIDESTGGVQEGDCTNQEVIKETKIGKQEGDYANQEVIAGAASGNEEGDHSNQEIIAGAASGNEEGDHSNQEIIAGAASGNEEGDHSNQGIIAGAASDNEEGDYANQEIIALAASGNEEGDYANQVIIDENCSKESDYDDDSKLRTVRGAMPIRSRTLTPERSDYMNQELLYGDIIPLSLAVPSSSATALGAGSILQGDTWTRKTPDYANVSGEEDDGREQKETPVDLRVDSREPSPMSALLTPQLSLPQSPASSRRSLSPQDERETAIDFRGSSPHSTHGSELVPLRSAPGSGYSSGATTPDALSIDSLDYEFDEKPSDVSQPPLLVIEDNDGSRQGRGISRVAASVRGSTGRHQAVSLPLSLSLLQFF